MGMKPTVLLTFNCILLKLLVSHQLKQIHKANMTRIQHTKPTLMSSGANYQNYSYCEL